MTALVGVTFIVVTAQAYYGGVADGVAPFEVERVKEYILVPFIFLVLWIAAILGGIVLSVIFPVTEKKYNYKDNAKNLERLKERMPTSGNESFDSAKKKLTKYAIVRMCVWGATLAFCLAAAIVIIVYAYSGSHYHSDTLAADILNFARYVMSWTAAALVCAIAATIVDEVMAKREIAQVKTILVNGDKSTVPAPKEAKKWAIIGCSVAAGVVTALAVLAYVLLPIVIHATLNTSQTVIYVVVFIVAAVVSAAFAGYYVVRRYVPGYVPAKVEKIIIICARVAVGVTAVVFIIVGALNGDAHDVLIKAINICTECIGLG